MKYKTTEEQIKVMQGAVAGIPVERMLIHDVFNRPYERWKPDEFTRFDWQIYDYRLVAPPCADPGAFTNVGEAKRAHERGVPVQFYSSVKEWVDVPGVCSWEAKFIYRVNPCKPVPPGDLTFDEAKRLFNDGVPIQFNDGYGVASWIDVDAYLDGDSWDRRATAFRRKPEKKYGPMTADDFPPVFWIRLGTADTQPALVVSLTPSALGYHPNVEGDIKLVEFSNLVDHWQYSTDRKEWKDCRKEVAQ